ncbi:surface-adhesin E family protein [Stenomitos frigidus]|uniref:Surface-adhesin protein E-like domain-containing protein n=1 Tax=Stenomitos frigidus ULC18 TaxID=2107698 RepID=A0A2T1EB49_9CYAN|nr:surface-adhesin E family protein [Stenomitos frigidus]PSB29923.1 hypothetical protein C7B82_10240 [Stenomitos frigidus ULC18]
MKFKGLLVTVAIGLGVLLPGVARAVQWEEVAIGRVSRIYLDIHSVQKRGKTVRYWDQVVFNVAQPDGVRSYKSLNTADCTTRTWRVSREVNYNDSGQVMSDGALKTKAAFTAIPGTIQGTMIERVCRR